MKKSIFILMFVLFGYSIKSQICMDRNNFMAVTGYVQFASVGLEMGLWPVDKPFGIFLGGAYIENRSHYNKLLDDDQYGIDAYIKPTYRLNRNIYITTTVGVVQFSKFYASFGTRFVIPVDDGHRFAFILEPQYGTRGINTQCGVSIGLN
jgi:hypothetical protein